MTAGEAHSLSFAGRGGYLAQSLVSSMLNMYI